MVCSSMPIVVLLRNLRPQGSRWHPLTHKELARGLGEDHVPFRHRPGEASTR